MKKKYLFLLLIFGIQIDVSSQTCLPEGITFTTQEQIDNFQQNYPNCTEIEGDVSILGDGIRNLAGLDVLSAFNADLLIYNCESLKNLSGLENVNYIGGSLSIKSNDSLSFLSGLDNLSIIDSGRLYLHFNSSLTNLTGLEGLYSIGEGIDIQSNVLLENINALENIDSTGFLIMNYNSSLKNLQGLHNLTSLSHFCFIRHTSLKNFIGLEGLVSIGGEVQITDNDSLIDFTGMTNLSTIKGGLTITDNVSLVSLDGLNSVDSAANLHIHDNPSLSTCETESVCNYLSNPIGSVNIYNNAPGCDSPSEVANACGFTLSCLPHGNYYLLSQTDIDDFQINYSGCSMLEGSVRIEGDDISNLDGLNNITSIAGHLRIFFNNSLSGLAGLENLKTVDGSLMLRDNDALTNLTGLDSISSCGGLSIRDCDNLISLSGMLNLTSTEGDFRISENAVLTDMTGMEQLTAIQQNLIVYENNSLISLQGLDSVGFIGGGILISDNPLIESLTGLEKPSSIGGNLSVKNNNSLISLVALQNLDAIDGFLIIEKNDLLANLFGLDNINAETISDLSIHSNPLLSLCAVQSVCDYLENPNGDTEIYNNAAGCDTQTEVEEACLTIGLADVLDNSALTIYPNPVNDNLNILLSNGLSLTEVCIYNQLGQKLLCETGDSGTVKTSILDQGIYIIEIITNKMHMRKILIVRH